jgi:predicted glycogen debranching enzyme
MQIAEHRLTGAALVRRMPWEGAAAPDWAPLVDREWLVTNGLGGYASGTISGAATRRYHGLLIAALPSPLGRWLMLADIAEELELADGTVVRLGGEEREGSLELHGAAHLREFRLDDGLPCWVYDAGGVRFEKSLFLPHMQNTVVVRYERVGGGSLNPVRLRLRPIVRFRPHDEIVSADLPGSYCVTPSGVGWEITRGASEAPPLRLRFHGPSGHWQADERIVRELLYRVEAYRGYAAIEALWSGGFFETELRDELIALTASTEPWDAMVDPAEADEALATELQRRHRLVERAPAAAREGPGGELVVAADQFIITPAVRVEDTARARAEGGEARSVIAGYHWFTDWGRDTMISLEGLTLATGRHREAGAILRTFSHHVRDGLIPNLFPEGGKEGLYHTADATLWFFHAVDRYCAYTKDLQLLEDLLPTLLDIVRHHVQGTHFGIGVDPADGLLRQGAEGYQLTWMDAKVDGWVVTPRRGKAVEINALWYNALCLVNRWLSGPTDDIAAAAEVRDRAAQMRAAFNERFWYAEGGYLYDVIDGEHGADPAFRPNQLFAIALPHAVLREDRWARVVDLCRERLLTPVGLRSLAPGHPDYRPTYYGDLRTRDAAYHQGTVWGWLIGPYIDAWRKVYPNESAGARELLGGLIAHMDDACLGSMSEIFDADSPYKPRGCIAQAWSVAEVLRCWVALAE